MTLIPAYGRDYKSKAAVLADWNANKDFVVASIGGPGCYINKEQADKLEIWIRYAKRTKIVRAQ